MEAAKLLVFVLIMLPVVASIDCGDFVCTGDSAYCCFLDDGDYGCCWETVYSYWWFWCIWVFVFFLILSCSLACWRRRRSQMRYVVMTNSQYPTYGTVIHNSTTRTTYPTPQNMAAPPYTQQNMAAPPYAPQNMAAPPYAQQNMAAPPYAATQPPSYANKPPPYAR